MRSKLVIAAAVVALGLFAITAAPALAEPGGKGVGKGGGKGGRTAAPACTLTVPSSIQHDTYFKLDGSNFLPSTQLNIVHDGVVSWMMSSPEGRIYVDLWAGAVGPHQIVAKELIGSSWAQCGSISYTAS